MPSFMLDQADGRVRIDIPLSNAVIAGWTGRDAAARDRHIRELEEMGIAAPKMTPVYYRVSAARFTQVEVIEVAGGESSGEVEFMLLRHQGKLYVGAGSDHTDRKVETYNVTVSKQMCDKPVSPILWDYNDVRGHWDSLVLRSWIGEDCSVLYQEGGADALLHPDDTLAGYEARHGALPDATAMLCGTLAAIGGIRVSRRFRFELHDPVMGRSITHTYATRELPVEG
jgi:hypothetical protein